MAANFYSSTEIIFRKTDSTESKLLELLSRKDIRPKILRAPEPALFIKLLTIEVIKLYGGFEVDVAILPNFAFSSKVVVLPNATVPPSVEFSPNTTTDGDFFLWNLKLENVCELYINVCKPNSISKLEPNEDTRRSMLRSIAEAFGMKSLPLEYNLCKQILAELSSEFPPENFSFKDLSGRSLGDAKSKNYSSKKEEFLKKYLFTEGDVTMSTLFEADVNKTGDFKVTNFEFVNGGVKLELEAFVSFDSFDHLKKSIAEVTNGDLTVSILPENEAISALRAKFAEFFNDSFIGLTIYEIRCSGVANVAKIMSNVTYDYDFRFRDIAQRDAELIEFAKNELSEFGACICCFKIRGSERDSQYFMADESGNIIIFNTSFNTDDAAIGDLINLQDSRGNLVPVAKKPGCISWVGFGK